MANITYEIDPHNRLIAATTGRKTPVSKFRHAIDGRFKIGKGNTLIYHIKAPSEGTTGQLDLPHQLKFRGSWSLTKNHDLRLTLDKWRRQTFGDKLTLQGEIIKQDAHALLFAVTQRTKEQASTTYALKLEGMWQADNNNRLTFRVKKEGAAYDTLTFDGIWEVNRQHKIVYRYEKRRKTKTKKQSLVFDGRWNITGKKALTYQLDLEGESAFTFKIGRGAIENNKIKFEAGIGVSRKEKPVKKTLIIYGKWRVKEGTGLTFETEYEKGRLSQMTFGAEAKLLDNYRVQFTLRDESGKDIGISFTLSRKFIKGSGESFIKFLRREGERAVYIGAGISW